MATVTNPIIMNQLQCEFEAGERQGRAAALRELHISLCAHGVDRAVLVAKERMRDDTADGCVAMALVVAWEQIVEKL